MVHLGVLVSHAEPNERLLPASVDGRGTGAARCLARVHPRQPGDAQVPPESQHAWAIERKLISFNMFSTIRQNQIKFAPWGTLVFLACPHEHRRRFHGERGCDLSQVLHRCDNLNVHPVEEVEAVGLLSTPFQCYPTPVPPNSNLPLSFEKFVSHRGTTPG